MRQGDTLIKEKEEVVDKMKIAVISDSHGNLKAVKQAVEEMGQVDVIIPVSYTHLTLPTKRIV